MRLKLYSLFIFSTLLIGAVPAWSSETYVPPPDSVKPARVTVESIYAAKCSKCHPVSRPDGATKTPAEWEATVAKMRGKDPAWIGTDDASKIAMWLSGRALCNVKCTKCHTAERINTQKTAVQWQSTVLRMQNKQAGWISDDEKKLILFYLTDVQLLDLE